MRSIDVCIEVEDDGIGPFHQGVIGDDDLRLTALHEIRLLSDGSTVMLYEYTGVREAAERLAEEYLTSDDIEWQTKCIDSSKLMYAHDTDPSGLLRGLLMLLDNLRIIVDWPIRFPSDNQALVTLIGDDKEIRDGLSMVQDDIEISIERSGEYRTDANTIARRFTTKEREALRTAVELGHYRNPREASYQDIADELDRSTGTIGYHLRNAEAKVMGHLFNEAA